MDHGEILRRGNGAATRSASGVLPAFAVEVTAVYDAGLGECQPSQATQIPSAVH